jgi:aspartyl-tRNA(Asn)/glutamyl-tRNA(Gln) amidotransferase subunit A
MPLDPTPIEACKAGQYAAATDPVAILRAVLAHANGNLSKNTYIVFDPGWSLREAERLTEQFSRTSTKPPLYGVPVSLKDCFDLEGFHTSSGSKFYATHLPPASFDSAIAARLKAAGAILTGKTHLHQLAYGITGENQDYGDCLQPANGSRLTGGSSSGAAASVQEGSAVAGIGTDTGGSIRVPAALCGLCGYRSSLGVADWRGGAHLAPSFDTIGWLFRDLRDAPLLAEAIFDLPRASSRRDLSGRISADSADNATFAAGLTIGALSGPWLEECDPAVQRSMDLWKARLHEAGAKVEAFDPGFWSVAYEIYAGIQASEAAKLHGGFYHEFQPDIASRLAWGASLSEDDLRTLRQRYLTFRDQMQALFDRFDFVLAPATPVSRLIAGADQIENRPRILRYTTPASLAGLPVVTLPSSDCGLQLMAAHNDDRRLLRLSALLGERLACGHGLGHSHNRPK